jgi:hypothetical protein
MPTIDQIRTKIAEKIFQLDHSVAVHEYERYAKALSDLVAMYKSGDAASPRLHGWHIRNIATREKREGVGRWTIWHTWRMRGFMSLDDADATEKLFDAYIESIQVTFRDDETLGGLVFNCDAPGAETTGVQKLEARPVLFAGVLCHSAELGLTTQHLEP